MEKLTIKPWQVMQAYENGAKIESKGCMSPVFGFNNNPKWELGNANYRIANLTADGMRLDELVEKWPDKVNVLCHSGNYIYVDTTEFIKEMCETPSKIAKVKVKQEKKLRPWTMEEFEKYENEWFVPKDGKVKYRIQSVSTSAVCMNGFYVSLTDLCMLYKLKDGSPCGVLE